MAAFMLEVLLPDKTLYWGKAVGLTVRAIDGEVQVLPGHAPYVTILTAGEITLHTQENTCLHFKHNGGILEVAREKTSVLVYPSKEEGPQKN